MLFVKLIMRAFRFSVSKRSLFFCWCLLTFKSQPQRFYKLTSDERAFKMLKNDMFSLKSAKPFSSYAALKMGRRILTGDGKCRFPTFRTPLTAENDVINEQ